MKKTFYTHCHRKDFVKYFMIKQFKKCHIIKVKDEYLSGVHIFCILQIMKAYSMINILKTLILT